MPFFKRLKQFIRYLSIGPVRVVKVLRIILTGILTSMFFFPFEFTFLSGVNTKMMLAVAGLGCSSFELIRRKRGLSIPKELLGLIAIASAVSLASLLSITLNQTPDTTYVSYLISFAVWLSAAFAVCCAIKGTHEYISVRLVLDYLIAVCIIQCILALVIDNVVPIRVFVDRYFALDQELMHEINRLYGIGALLDIAGSRFSVVLAAMGFFLTEIKTSLSFTRRIIYIVSFLVITVIGSMIARTTEIGALIGFSIIILCFLFRPRVPEAAKKSSTFFIWTAILGLVIIISIILYNTSPEAKQLFRFGFEGFFTLVEEGHWETSSTNKLMKTMIVFPETIHTWMIGDGYFLNSRYDINYLGDATDQGFYMNTDVGYLRFIFYFGIIGLIPMMGVIVYSAIVCMRYFPYERLLFFLALLVGLIVWVKVSTDIFLFFALFLAAAVLQDKTPPMYLTDIPYD